MSGLRALVADLTRRKLVHNIFVGGYGQAIQMAMQFFGVPIMLGAWGLETYGIWLLLFAIPSYLAIADFGLATAATNDMVALAAQGRRDEAARIYVTTRRMVLILSAVMILAALAFVVSPWRSLLDFAAPATHDRPILTFLILTIYGVVALSNSVTMAGFSASDNFAKGGATFQTIGLVEGALGLLAVVLGGSIFALASVYCTVRLVGSVVALAIQRKAAPWLAQGRTSGLAVMRPLLAPAAASIAMPVASATAFQGSLIGLGAAAGAGATPLLATPRTATRFALQIAMIVSVASIQRFTIAHSQGWQDRKAAIALVNFAAVVVLVLPAAAIMLLAGPWLVALWTNGHVVVGRDVIVPLVLSLVLAGLWKPMANMLVALNRHGSFAFAAAIVSLAAVGAGTLLAKDHGAVGMAWCVAAFDIFMLGWIARIVLRERVVEPTRMIAVAHDAKRWLWTRRNRSARKNDAAIRASCKPCAPHRSRLRPWPRTSRASV